MYMYTYIYIYLYIYIYIYICIIQYYILDVFNWKCSSILYVPGGQGQMCRVNDTNLYWD